MSFIFCKIENSQKKMKMFFKLKKLKKHEFDFLQACKRSKKINQIFVNLSNFKKCKFNFFFFCELKKLKKHEFHCLQD